jgi:hypothetical protein
MKRALVLILALGVVSGLAACSSGPNLGVGIGVGSGGVSVGTSVSGKVGDVGVTVSN